MKRLVVRFRICGTACPQVFVDESADKGKQVIITDDFGGQITFSKSQFQVFVKKAKAGELKI